MVFESLSEKLQNTLNKLTGKGKLTEKDIDAAMREVKLALLEADVNFKVFSKKNHKELASCSTIALQPYFHYRFCELTKVKRLLTIHA